MITHHIIHSRSQELINFACEFARESHGQQCRKYINDPYIIHPIEVATIVSTVTDDCNIISAAFLHDVLEDTSVTFENLIEIGFGFPIAKLVLEVTDISKLSDGNRSIRKEIDLTYLSKASPNAKTIKLADLISNSRNIMIHDQKFAKVYMAEKKRLLTVLCEGNEVLYNTASQIVNEYYNK